MQACLRRRTRPLRRSIYASSIRSSEAGADYDLRGAHFSCNPGRLPALLHLFETHVLKIWDKHGIKQVGFWTVLVGDGSNDLHCCIAWQSLAERERKWTEFEADPKWIAARDKSNKKGSILANIDSVFLKPTSFSAMK